ncbi:hypothetical protein B0H13DRAFT_1868413 [Mycena leptocephala]|nr:hypothetical protein B0H13DRAFT_1868413 [Mycena leptocephala]
MSFSQNPGDFSYRHKLGKNGLVLRWSTAADKAGCILLSCLAMGQQEGRELEFGVRYIEPYMDDAFYSGSSTNWAICVDTSPVEEQDVKSESRSESYVDRMRAEAESASERVVALVYFLPGEISFDRDAARLAIGKAQIVACKPAYRQRGGGENIVKALFEMVHARALATGCTLMTIVGIPMYYRTHGATLSDLPALERLVSVPRATADIFAGVSTPMLRAQLRWLLGDRPESYSAAVYPVHPFFVLEKRDSPKFTLRVVGAAGLLNSSSPSAIVHPLLWDGMEDASSVALAVVRGLIQALDAETKLTTVRWVLTDVHPLRRWLLAHELAVPAPASPRYDHTSVWWAAIPSLPAFLSALAPALAARVARAAPILGANYTGVLHIAAPRAMGGDVLLRADSGAVSVAVPPAGSKPTLSLPRGALTQLLLGYASWNELKVLSPDVAVEPSVVPLVEVLFPKRAGIGSTMLGVHCIVGEAMSFK